MSKKATFFKTFTSIKSIYVLLSILLLNACSYRTEPSLAKDNKLSTKQEKEISATEIPVLSYENAETFLNEYSRKGLNRIVSLNTDFGEIQIKLYANTPLHSANMLYLCEQNYFTETWFHRASKEHVIQAGNTDERKTVKKRKAIGKYTIPAEALEENFHKYGAVAAARSYKNNPEKKSDPFEFYITIGKVYSKPQLKAMEQEYNVSISENKKEVYSSLGGAPHLDGQHTVFGEVIKGMDVVEEISKVEVDEGEWPLTNIPITAKIL